MYFFHSQTQQRQQYDYGFLFIPGYIINNRQLVYIIKPEHLFQLQGDNRQRIAVVTLSGIQYAGNAVDVAQAELVIAVLGTTSRKDYSVLRQ